MKDQVAWVTINRPRVLNAFREQTLDEMIDALKSTREDPSIACAVVTGAGDKAFSAGGDFYAMKRLNFTNGAMWNDRMLGLAMTIRGLPIPVIAMVNGWCMGGGHELALWCDLVIASENAVLGQTGAKVGACPTVGATQYLPRIIGERLAREMIFCARRFTAKEAVEIGLINKCVPQKDLLKETLEWCETIKGHSPQTMRMTKKSLNFESDKLYASWQHGMELLAHVWGSEEAIEGMNAFLEGRKPNFQKFRMRNKRELEDYLDGCAKDLNAPPSMRKKAESPDDRSPTAGPLAGIARGRSDPHPRGSAVHHDARRHGRRRDQGRAAGHRRRHAQLGPAVRRQARRPIFSASTATSARSRSTWRCKPGQNILAGLIEKADVLIDNFKLGTLAKWGFTDAWFDEHAPKVVRCSITGYGSSGPKAAQPGYDFILQAESGLMSICGEPDGDPTKYGVAIVDVCTGMLACNAILAALNARHRTGSGQKVEVSLYRDVAGDAGQRRVELCWSSGKDGGRFGNGHPSIVPYTTYPAADGMIALAVGNDGQFARNARRCSAIPNGRGSRASSANRGRVENRAASTA